MKIPLLILCLGAFATAALAQADPARQLDLLGRYLPFEKLYLHTDHSAYQPGETVWFKAYLVGDVPGKRSPFVYVHLIDPQGKTVGMSILTCPTGQMDDGLPIPPGAGGVYTLRGTTNWLKNFGEDVLFEKKLTVQKTVKSRLRLRLETERNQYLPGERVLAKLEAAAADNRAIAYQTCQVTASFAGAPVHAQAITTDAEGRASFAFSLPAALPPGNGLLLVSIQYDGATESVARPIPVAEKSMVVQFFPEGGDLLLGWENRVAFEATDTLGNPLDCRGALLDQQGDTLLSDVASYHKGMGLLAFEPAAGKRYFLHLEGQPQPFALPDPLRGDFGLSLSDSDREGLDQRGKTPARPPERLSGSIHAARPASLLLVLRMADRLVYEQQMNVLPGETRFSLPVDTLPAGIVQLTVFDEKMRPHAERLAFVNPWKQLRLSITTRQERYLPGEIVAVDILAKDQDGQPVNGVFSIAVVEDRLWTQADDKQDNILSSILLTGELRGRVDEPSFYFDPRQEKAPRALDLLLLTHGWRRFTWPDFLEKTEPYIAGLVRLKQPPLPISGSVYFRRQPNHLEGVKVSIPGTDREVLTDKTGRFSLDATGLAFPLQIQAKFKMRAQAYEVRQPNILYPPPVIINKKDKSIGFDDRLLFDDAKLVAIQPSPAIHPTSQPENLLAGQAAGLELDITSSSKSLSEVVVVGYSSQRSLDLTSSVVHYSDLPPQWDATPNLGDNLYLNSVFNQAEVGPYIYLDNEYVYTNHRRFYQPTRSAQQGDLRNDFRKTVYWQPDLVVKNGTAQLHFQHSDEVSTFRIVVEGMGETGQVGRGEHTYYTQRPFTVEARLPAAVAFGDTILLEMRLDNHTGQDQPAQVKLDLPAHLHPVGDTATAWSVRLPAHSVETLRIPLAVGSVAGQFPLNLQLSADGQTDQLNQLLQVMPKGFPRELYSSGDEAEKSFRFEVEQSLKGSIAGSLVAYPHFIGEISDGLASIVREPHGCFEQVSSSNYPNIMALQVLNQSGILDFDFQKKSLKFLESGYKKLSGYECTSGGFSLYGHNPPDPRLTAYGLLQFWDMREVYPDVDAKLISRTLRWLLSRQDSQNGRFSPDLLTHVFSLYVLSELGRSAGQGSAGHFDPSIVESGLAGLDDAAGKTEDPYFLAILLCANLNAGRTVASETQVQHLQRLLKQQRPGKYKVAQTFSISYGKSMQVETAAWAALALSEAGRIETATLRELIDFLQKARSNYGGFGSTQATVMALKAFKSYYLKRGKSDHSGQVIVEINGHRDTLSYSADTYHKLSTDLAPWFKDGTNQLSIQQSGTGRAIPYTVQATWRSMALPVGEGGLPLSLETRLSSTKVKAGDFVQYQVRLHNGSDSAVHAPMAVIGIPAGLGIQGWQLQEMAKQRLFEYVEIQGNYLVAYYESMAPGEERRFQLDLKAEVPGQFEGPASYAYPYYTSELKYWRPGERVTVAGEGD